MPSSDRSDDQHGSDEEYMRSHGSDEEYMRSIQHRHDFEEEFSGEDDAIAVDRALFRD